MRKRGIPNYELSGILVFRDWFSEPVAPQYVVDLYPLLVVIRNTTVRSVELLVFRVEGAGPHLWID